MAMTTDQLTNDTYSANVRQVAPSYDADVFYSMYTVGDYLHCGKCGWKRNYANETVRAQDKAAHATPVRNASSLDINCPYATWAGAMATLTA